MRAAPATARGSAGADATVRAVRIRMLLFDDCVGSIVAGLLDAFAAANRFAGERAIDVALVSARGGAVRSSSGIAFDTLAAPIDPADRLIVPGVDHGSLEELLLRLERADAAVDRVRRHRAAGGGVGACCSGAFVLAAAGALDGREATTSWWLAGELAARFPDTRVRASRALVEDGPVLTAAAVGAWSELALALIAKAGGEDLAERVASVLLTDRARGAEAEIAVPCGVSGGRGLPVAKAEAWLRLHLSDPELGVRALAEACLVSERTLLRHFRATLGTTPERRLRELRMARARQLLESSSLPIATVAGRCGYASAAAFRRAFREGSGSSPSDYRGRFELVRVGRAGRGAGRRARPQRRPSDRGSDKGRT